MAYPYYGQPGYMTGGYYGQPAQDQLAQLRGQPVYMPQQAAQPPQPGAGSAIVWVQGEAGAKAYLVAPGSTVQLWDSEDQVIYLKSVDANGLPSMRRLRWTDEPANAAPAAQARAADCVTRSEFDALAARVEALAKPAAQRKGSKEGADRGEPTV